MSSLDHLNIEVTKRCNQDCFYCFNDSKATAPQPSIDVEEWIRIFRTFRNYGLESIHVTGGEPFVWQGTIPLLVKSQDLGLETSILSNGLKIPALAGKHPEVFTELTVAQISLDAMTPEVHNARRGLPGAWEHATDAIETLRALDISVEVSCVVSRENLSELEALAEYCWQLDAQLILRPLVPVGRAANQNQCANLSDSLDSVRSSLADKYPGLIIKDRFNYVPDGPDTEKQGGDIYTVTASGAFREAHVSTSEEKTIKNVKTIL